MHLDCGTVQPDGFDLDADDLSMLQLRKYPIQHSVLRPAVHPGVDGVPVAEPLGQATPFAALLGNIQERVQHPQIGQATSFAKRYSGSSLWVPLCAAIIGKRSAAAQ
jgi:hypothetical protein